MTTLRPGDVVEVAHLAGPVVVDEVSPHGQGFRASDGLWYAAAEVRAVLPPASPFPVVEQDPADIAAEFEEWWQAGEAERSADRLLYGDVDSTAIETGRTDLS